MKSPCTLFEIDINTESLESVLKQVHQFTDSGTPHHITTVNTEFLMESRRNPQFKSALQKSDIRLADGAGIVLAAALTDQTKPPRIPGVDFVQSLAHEAAKQGWKLFLLGGRGGVAQKTAEILTNLNPGLIIAGISEESPSDPSLISLITQTHPSILLVAWGAPKQDLWIAQHKKELGVPVMMGVGGTFDLFAGKQKRAPQWMRTLGLEWLWRLALEPCRWKRQLALPKMFLLILWHKMTGQTV